jgi:hypothetical protein
MDAGIDLHHPAITALMNLSQFSDDLREEGEGVEDRRGIEAKTRLKLR